MECMNSKQKLYIVEKRCEYVEEREDNREKKIRIKNKNTHTHTNKQA